MRKMNDGRAAAERDEVEELLRAVADEAVLSLSVDAHIAASSESDYLHPDLNRRFEALKSSSSAAAASSSKAEAKAKTKTKAEEKEVGDLCGRFAALKASVPPFQSHPCPFEIGDQPSAAGQVVAVVDADSREEDQVAEVIQWAMDAAQLDPSSPPPDYSYHSYSGSSCDISFTPTTNNNNN